MGTVARFAGVLCAIVLTTSAARLFGESGQPGQSAEAPLRVLVVTGGHGYPTSFYTLFEQPGLVWDHETTAQGSSSCTTRSAATTTGYRDLVGGHYLIVPQGGMPTSTYQHDETIPIARGRLHPITRGFTLTEVYDEVYKGTWISPDVTVLMTTTHPLADPEPSPALDVRGLDT